MAKFLNTSGVSYHIEELIKGTSDKLILISPYLQFSDRIKEHLQVLNLHKKDIRIVYRESKLHPDENNWLASQIGVRTSICKNLHAKCYMNDKEAIITSMNLYEFSQVNNNEMGIFITKEADPELFKATFEEVQRLLTISEEVRITVQKVSEKKDTRNEKQKATASSTSTPSTGYCIRTGSPIPFNIERPLSPEAYKSWEKFSNPDYPEKYCHFTGEPSNGETSKKQPIMRKNWKKAVSVFPEIALWKDLPW